MPAMRHLGSLLAGLLAAPAAWLLLAIGQPQMTRTIKELTEAERFNTVDLIGPVAYLAVAGVVLGLIASLRVSPAGPGIAGIALAVPHVALFVSPPRTIDAIPKRVDLGIADALPRVPLTNGTLALLACCLLVAVFSADRWRRSPAPRGEGATASPVAATGDAASEPGGTGTGTDGPAPGGQDAPREDAPRDLGDDRPLAVTLAEPAPPQVFAPPSEPPPALPKRRPHATTAAMTAAIRPIAKLRRRAATGASPAPASDPDGAKPVEGADEANPAPESPWSAPPGSGRS